MIYLVPISIASLLANGLLAFKYFKGLKEKEELSLKLKTVTDFAEVLSVKLLKEAEERRVIKAAAIDIIEEKAIALEAVPAKKRGRRKKPNTNKAI